MSVLGKNRDFTLLWSAGAASALGVQMSAVAYPLIALEVTGSAVQAGVLGSLALLAQAVLRLPAGALADRWDRRRAMLSCDVVRIVVVVGVIACLLSEVLGFWILLAAAVVNSACEAVFQPAETAALRRVVRTEDLPRAVAVNEARGHAAAIGGQPLGGLLLGLGRPWPFAGQLLGLLYSLAATLLIRVPIEGHRSSGNLLGDIVKGLRWTWEQRVLRVILSAGVGINLAFSALLFGVVVIAREGGATSAQIGLMSGMSSVGGLLGGLAAAWIVGRWKPSTVLLAVFWTNSVLIPLMAVHPTVQVMGVLLAFMLFLTPAANAILIGFQMAMTPDHLQGRVISSMRLIITLGNPLGPFLVGLLIERWGAVAALVAISLVMLLVTVGSTLSRVMRRLPSLSGG